MSIDIKNIVIAGSGNVAWHLAKALSEAGFTISGIWSRNAQAAEDLALMCCSKVLSKTDELPQNTHLLIVAISDTAIPEAALHFSTFKGIIVHTAGSVGIDVFAKAGSRSGVLYPLQTLSKHTAISLTEVPFFIEGSDETVRDALHKVAQKITTKVYYANSQQRLLLHIAAVFASNYANLMYSIADTLLIDSKIPFSVLHALISETAQKAIAAKPEEVQTGPARRNDKSTIQKHLKMLEKQPDIASLYQHLADFILNKYNSKS